MLRRRTFVSAELMRLMRRAREADRPQCPSCGQHSPAPKSDEYAGASWFQAWGHRCPHGDPCPGWSKRTPTCESLSCRRQAPTPCLPGKPVGGILGVGATTTAEASMSKGRKVPESEIEEAVDAVFEELDDHELASAEVVPRVTIDFYDAIRSRAQERVEQLRAEHGVDEEPSEDDED